MDRGVLESLKCRYRRKILEELVLRDNGGSSLVEFLKGINLQPFINIVFDHLLTPQQEESFSSSDEEIVASVTSEPISQEDHSV